MKRLYECEITYTFQGWPDKRYLLCYVVDSSWVNTCIPTDWRLSQMSYTINFDKFIERKVSAVIPHEQVKLV